MFEVNVGKSAWKFPPLGSGGDNLTQLPIFFPVTRFAFVHICRNSNKNAVSSAVWNRDSMICRETLFAVTR